MGFLVKLRVKFVLVRGVGLDAVLRLAHLVLAPHQLTILHVCCLDRVELFRLELAARHVDVLICPV